MSGRRKKHGRHEAELLQYLMGYMSGQSPAQEGSLGAAAQGGSLGAAQQGACTRCQQQQEEQQRSLGAEGGHSGAEGGHSSAGAYAHMNDMGSHSHHHGSPHRSPPTHHRFCEPSPCSLGPYCSQERPTCNTYQHTTLAQYTTSPPEFTSPGTTSPRPTLKSALKKPSKGTGSNYVSKSDENKLGSIYQNQNQLGASQDQLGASQDSSLGLSLISQDSLARYTPPPPLTDDTDGPWVPNTSTSSSSLDTSRTWTSMRKNPAPVIEDPPVIESSPRLWIPDAPNPVPNEYPYTVLYGRIPPYTISGLSSQATPIETVWTPRTPGVLDHRSPSPISVKSKTLPKSKTYHQDFRDGDATIPKVSASSSFERQTPPPRIRDYSSANIMCQKPGSGRGSPHSSNSSERNRVVIQERPVTKEYSASLGARPKTPRDVRPKDFSQDKEPMPKVYLPKVPSAHSHPLPSALSESDSEPLRDSSRSRGNSPNRRSRGNSPARRSRGNSPHGRSSRSQGNSPASVRKGYNTSRSRGSSPNRKGVDSFIPKRAPMSPDEYGPQDTSSMSSPSARRRAAGTPDPADQKALVPVGPADHDPRTCPGCRQETADNEILAAAAAVTALGTGGAGMSHLSRDPEAYLGERHQRAMVRLCALLWVANQVMISNFESVLFSGFVNNFI